MKTATMKTAATYTPDPYEVPPYAKFKGGPFHNRTSLERLPIPPGAAPGTWLFCVPYPMTIEAAVIWGTVPYCAGYLPPSTAAHAYYTNGEGPGEWCYVPRGAE
jgi:hypothetical protein